MSNLAELAACGISEENASLLGPLGLGELAPKLGIYFEEISAHRMVATMPVAGNTQPAGLLHGGASAALAETLGSFAAHIHAGVGKAAVGVDLNITHLSSAKTGRVTATCLAEKLGRMLCVHRIEITQDDRLIASARITNMVVDTPKQ